MTLTKTTALLTAILGCVAVPAQAVADHNYELVGAKAHSFSVYNDGKNTYVEIVRGLTVPGSKREGDSFVIDGVRPEIEAQYGGKKISIKLRTPTTARAVDTYTYAADSTSSLQSQTPVPAAPTAPVLDSRAQAFREEEMLAEMREEVKAQVQLEIQAIEKTKTAAATQKTANEPKAEAKAEAEPKPPIERSASESTKYKGLAPAPSAAPAHPAKEPEPIMPKTKPVQVAATVLSPEATETSEPKPGGPRQQINEAIEVSDKVLFSEQAAAETKVLSVIKKGRLIDDALQERALAEGWTFSWNSKKHWEAIADIDISKYKTADEAAEDLVNGLRDEGKPIQLRISEGNKVMEVFSTEVKND